MTVASTMLIGIGILCCAIGAFFLYTHFTKAAPNDEYEWYGYGKHPFRR